MVRFLCVCVAVHFRDFGDDNYRNSVSNLLVFSQVLAQLLLKKIRLLLCSLYPPCSNENPKTIAALTFASAKLAIARAFSSRNFSSLLLDLLERPSVLVLILLAASLISSRLVSQFILELFWTITIVIVQNNSKMDCDTDT